MTVLLKSQQEIEKMRIAGKLASEVLDYITPFVKPGVTTDELDTLCHDYMVNVQNTIPAPLNYAPPGYSPYPKSICTSVNHQVCHGVPGQKILKSGDIVNIDVTVIKDDTTATPVACTTLANQGSRPGDYAKLTYESMWRGIEEIRPGKQLGDVGHAIQQFAESHGYSVVREFCGHGIGAKFHEDPRYFTMVVPVPALKLKAGMIFTVEPMINAGKAPIRQMADGWTIVTKDHSVGAMGHTVLVTETGYEVLTLSAGSPPKPVLPFLTCHDAPRW